jgi:signal transduction histidine kinase
MEKGEVKKIEKTRREKIFSYFFFITAFLVFGIFTTVQMRILGDYILYQDIPTIKVIIVIIFWGVMALAFTLLTRFQVNHYYERPIRMLAEGTKKVANGDFSVYLKPVHTNEHMNFIDVMFHDFNKMVEELGSIETLKSGFFSSVSHEIKTPLAIIQNYAELLQNESLKPEVRQEYTLAIYHATKRLSNLITNMLKLNKLENQTIPVTPEPYDVCAQICDCTLQFEKLWESKDIEMNVDIEDKATIEVDESLMEIVWNNLLSNAIKFTEQGGTVSVRQTSTIDEVIVEISDSGCGMDEKTAKHIFDKFYQGDTSHSTEGNGLGLALVLRILQLMNGSISVKSELERGTTFTVRIPTVKEVV